MPRFPAAIAPLTLFWQGWDSTGSPSLQFEFGLLDSGELKNTVIHLLEAVIIDPGTRRIIHKNVFLWGKRRAFALHAPECAPGGARLRCAGFQSSGC